MTIAVTGATGGVGSRVLRHLLARAAPPSPVALARRPQSVAAPVPVRHADYDEPGTLRAALTGVRTLVFISSDGEAETIRRHHRHVVAAAQAAGVDHVVYTSISSPRPDSGFYYAPVHHETEAALAATGIDHCLARTSVFSDFFASTWVEPALREGELALPTDAGRMSLVTRDDTARALAAAAAHGRRGVLELTGPQAVTAREAAEQAAAVTGRPLRFVALDELSYRRRLARAGAPAWLADAFSSMFAAVEQGEFAAVSPDVEACGGVAPQSFAEFLRARWPRAQTGRAAMPGGRLR
jgi:NAD(P)H dehydrogenase (quinone)